MDFTIYVLGDVRLFADTLNGIAMMFTVAGGEKYNLWASNTNSMGLGMGAFLGVLLSLALLVYNAAFRQRFDFRAVIIPLVLYIVLTVPKVTVNVVDAYGVDGVQTVDNVPLGLAFPMSAISGISLSATETLETIFRVPNASFTKITEDGFVMPLKLLHSMRYTGLTMRDAYPNITDSVAEVVKICLTNNEGFNPKAYQNSGNSMAVFYDALAHPSVASRLVKVYPATAPTGTITNCEKSAEYIKNSMESYLSGTVASGAINLISTEEIKIKNFRNDLQKILASNNGNTGSRMLTSNNLSTQRVLDDIQALTTATNSDVLAFAQATLFNPQLSAATECVSSSDNASTARCFTYNTTQEQWKERSAAEASGFLSIMRDGQNLLILLSVTLFPIMVLIVVLQGLGGLKVVMSYLLYTISAYMWIPVAAMINWYVQVQLNDELEKWRASVPAGLAVGDVYLSLANAPLFYDAVSKKLALANSVMASVPMICMGLFSGMLMTMNRLADKMNPQTGYDASANTPSAVSRDSLAKVGSSVSFEGSNSVGKQSGLLEMSTLKAAAQVSAVDANMKANAKTTNEALAKTAAHDIYMSKDTQAQVDHTRAMLKQRGFSDQQANQYSDSRSSQFQIMKGMGLVQAIGSGTTMSEQQAFKYAQQAAIAAGFKGKDIETVAGITALMSKEYGALMGKSANENNAFSKMSQETGQTITAQNAQHMDTQTASKLWQESNTATYKEAATDTKGFSDRSAKSVTYQSGASILEQSSRVEAENKSIALNFEAPMSVIANASKATQNEIANNLEAFANKQGPEFQQQVAAIEKTAGEVTVNRGDAQAIRMQSILQAAQANDDMRAEANVLVAGGLINQPVRKLNEVKNEGLEERVASQTADVLQATKKASGLSEQAVLDHEKSIKKNAAAISAEVAERADDRPAPTLQRVGDAASVVDAKADKELTARKEAVAENINAAAPKQGDGTNKQATYDGNSLQFAGVNMTSEAQNSIQEKQNIVNDRNASVLDKGIAIASLPKDILNLGVGTALSAATGANNQTVTYTQANPENPTGKPLTVERKTLDQARKDKDVVTNLDNFTPMNAIANVGQKQTELNKNDINHAIVNGRSVQDNPLAKSVDKAIHK